MRCQPTLFYRCAFRVSSSYPSSKHLLLNRLDTVPPAAQPLLPQTNSVVASADREHIAAEAPAYTPCGGVDVEDCRFPVV
jgi:hypothetical protein